MIRSAKSLCDNSFMRRMIVPAAREVLSAIERMASDATKEGRGHIEFDVPKVYPTIGDDPVSVLAVNAMILRELIDAGYTVAIRDCEHSLLFTITWSIELGDRDIRAMEALLTKHMKGD